MDFLTIYTDCEDLVSLLHPYPIDNPPSNEELNKKLPEEFYHFENPLKEYVVMKGTAIVEQGYRNLITFLIDNIGIDVYSLLNVSNTLEIPIDELEKLSDKKITKGLLIADSLTFSKPYLINKQISKLLKLDFHDTLKNLQYLIPETVVENDPEKMNTLENFWELAGSFDKKHIIAQQFETIFELRNEIAHNATSISLENLDLHWWIQNISSYLQYGTALVLFYGIFCTKFNDYDSLSKIDYFKRDDNYTNPPSIDEIKEVFEMLFGVTSEKLIEYIKSQQQKYHNSK